VDEVHVIKCRNQRKAVVDWLHQDLPNKADLQSIVPGNYIRLQAAGGTYFWARVISKEGKHLVVIADDTLCNSEVTEGDQLITSTGAVFSIV
jgi:hypothetical protein